MNEGKKFYNDMDLTDIQSTEIDASVYNDAFDTLQQIFKEGTDIMSILKEMGPINNAYIDRMRYMGYIEEDVDAATKDMESGKNPVYKETYIFRDKLIIPHIGPAMTKKTNREKIINAVGQFIDANSKQLTTMAPVHMFVFLDKDTKFLYDIFGITKAQVLEIFDDVIEDTYSGELVKFLRGFVLNAPHKLIITAMLSEALNKIGSSDDSEEFSYKDMIDCAEYLMGFSEYPIVFRDFWPYGVREDIMDYTVEHLSGRYKLIRLEMNNVLELIKYDMNKSFLKHQEELKIGMDYSYIDFIQRVRNQIKNTFKKLAQAYYINHEQNATQHSKSDKLEDGTLSTQEGYTSNVASIIETTYNKFVNAGVNDSWVSVASEGNVVDQSTLKSFISKIYITNNNRLDVFIESVITAYFLKNPSDTSLDSKEFLTFGLSLYKSISTSKSETYRRIRETLDYWIHDIINIEEYYPKGGTTVSNYSRAIFNYMIWMIKYHN